MAGYSMRISRLTIDKLGVKLYDKVSAVVAELIANSYDADATHVDVMLPLGTELATKKAGAVEDHGYEIVVTDNGHGMTPEEAQDLFLVVGTDRRTRHTDGPRSREKNRHVMGRKGIGKLAPFGICRCIEIISAGGEKTSKGFITSHFLLDFQKLVSDSEEDVPIDSGEKDGTYCEERGTTVRLTNFLPKRVPIRETFERQVARRFALGAPDFDINVHDSRSGDNFQVPKFQVPVNEETRVDVGNRPVKAPDGTELPVKGWLAFAKTAYKNEEEAGVRIYARGKIVATTRDFEQPAGFTGEFTTRSYLVGEIHAEWLDADNDDDLIRTDRQGILWDSDYGEALRQWGATLIKEIAAASAGPRRERKQGLFLAASRLEERAKERYDDESVIEAVMDLGRQIGAFASEDELGDQSYVEGLTQVILATGPHQALIAAFREISDQTDKSLDDLLALFGKTRVAEMASYAQIAAERVQSIKELESVVDDSSADEGDLQNLIARAPWLIRSDWSVISENQGLKTFVRRFKAFWQERHSEPIEIAISYENKRPDFTLVSVGRELHIVELKAPNHTFDDKDYERLENYLEAFEQFFAANDELAREFPEGWHVDLICDRVVIRDTTKKRAFRADMEAARVAVSNWNDFLTRANQSHAQFLDARDRSKDST